jgi:hypothetical protein
MKFGLLGTGSLKDKDDSAESYCQCFLFSRIKMIIMLSVYRWVISFEWTWLITTGCQSSIFDYSRYLVIKLVKLDCIIKFKTKSRRENKTFCQRWDTNLLSKYVLCIRVVPETFVFIKWSLQEGKMLSCRNIICAIFIVMFCKYPNNINLGKT